MNRMRRKDGFCFDREAVYRIRVEGSLEPSWSDRLAGMIISHETSVEGLATTILEGELCDQASLAGVLGTLYDLHRAVLLVERLSPADNMAQGITTV